MPLLAGINTGFQRLSKYLSKAARKRLPLSPKRTGKGFYKGNKCASTGRINSIGRFRMDERKRVELNVPDLTGFKLKPYVSPTVFKYPVDAGIIWPPTKKTTNFFGV
ncbi:mitochondrial ribosomal protein l27 [Nannochloropsis gaditana]|uniref:Mitochondrial ribosomal protein l27 n=1 Tax=Nannochloropsis gaditana TaxID=72520 RepID=W7U3M5_9STRA|nr:mitochondrial ribosomal protein l27 [Nannochloropsis gaditana]